MRYIILIACVLANFKNLKVENASTTSCGSKWDALLKIKVYTQVDRMPEYPGGQNAFNVFFLKNYHLSKEEDFQATLKLEFVIDSKGRLIGERILNKDISNISVAEKEALRVLRKMPKWKAGICRSKPVPVDIIMPIRF